MLFAPRKPKSTVFTMFFASGNKNQIYSVFWPVPSKNTGIYAVFCMLQEILFPCQRRKNTVNYRVLGLLFFGFVEGAEGWSGSGSFPSTPVEGLPSTQVSCDRLYNLSDAYNPNISPFKYWLFL